MKVLILGHTGLLGNCVFRYFSKTNFEIETLPIGMRWPSEEMINFINNSDAEWIINCIGSIPQRTKNFLEVNSKLPIFLFSTKKKIIHPSTDCEFSGNIAIGETYKVDSNMDATDDYGISKSIPTDISLKFDLKNVYLIRTSILGIDRYESSLLSWFLGCRFSWVNGYDNHYWNGITTLEWAKISLDIILKNHDSRMIQPSSYCISKYDLLNIFSKVFDKKIVINKVECKYCNKCLESTLPTRDIESMLIELKEFYNI